MESHPPNASDVYKYVIAFQTYIHIEGSSYQIKMEMCGEMMSTRQLMKTREIVGDGAKP